MDCKPCLSYTSGMFFPVFLSMKDLLAKVNRRSTLTAAAIAAVLFNIPVFIYIKEATYRSSWLLYVGSFLFLIVVWIHTFLTSRSRHHNETTVALSFNAHLTTLTGILFSCIIAFILLAIFVPGYLSPGMADKIQTGEPVNTIHDKTDGLSFEIFIAATIINFSVGSFTGIVLPFALKRKQKENVEF